MERAELLSRIRDVITHNKRSEPKEPRQQQGSLVLSFENGELVEINGEKHDIKYTLDTHSIRT